MYNTDSKAEHAALEYTYHNEVHHYRRTCICNGYAEFVLVEEMADNIYVIGSFNNWSESHPMTKMDDGDNWMVRIGLSEISVGTSYKYKIYKNGRVTYKTDPCSLLIDDSPYMNSVLSEDIYDWNDSEWLSQRNELYSRGFDNNPINIYELNLETWNEKSEGISLTYKELAAELPQYLKQMGYTHVLFNDVLESFYFDENGYKIKAYFAPNNKQGSNNEFRFLVESLHRAHVGIIINWDIDMLSIPQFNREYYIEALKYWTELYHIDGIICLTLRFNELSDWEYIIAEVKKSIPDFCVIGCGQVAWSNNRIFDLVFNEIWHDNVNLYMQSSFENRVYSHMSLISAISSGINRNGLLLTTDRKYLFDEKSLFDKMPGDEWRRFAGARAYMALQTMCCGKKMTYMGDEICANGIEGQDFSLLSDDMRAKFQLYCSDLNNFYLQNPSLWRSDEKSFKWTDAMDADRNLIIFRRMALGEDLVIAINLSANVYEGFTVYLDKRGMYREIFNSDRERYGGSGVTNQNVFFESVRTGFTSDNIAKIQVRIPPLGVTVFKRMAKSEIVFR